MTNEELIAQLLKLPPNLTVMTINYNNSFIQDITGIKVEPIIDIQTGKRIEYICLEH
jgi:hypothetical protein